jgi:hypothetical protein
MAACHGRASKPLEMPTMPGFGRYATRTCDTPDERPRRDWDNHRGYAGADDPRTQRNLWPEESESVGKTQKQPQKFQTATQSKRERLAFARSIEGVRPEAKPTIATSTGVTADDLCAIATLAVAAGMIETNQALGVARTLLRAYRASLSFRIAPDDTPTDMAYRPVTMNRAGLRWVAIKLHVALADDEALALTLAGRVLAAVLANTR